MKKRFRNSRRAAERVCEILDRLHGRSSRRGGDDKTRERGGRRGKGSRQLSIEGNETLFAELVRQDFEYLLGLRLAAAESWRRVLLPQSVLGRAQNGHGFFVDEFGTPLIFADATFDRVLSVLEVPWPDLRHDRVRAARNEVIEAVRRVVMAGLDSETILLADEKGPLLGAGFLAEAEVETLPFLRGMVLAGYMDDYQQRQMCTSWHRLNYNGERYEIGGGEIRIVDRERMAMAGVMEPGRRAFTDDEMHMLADLGVLMPADDSREWSFPDYDQEYFRRRLGDGVCDDLALIRVGVEHGRAGLLGAFVMDAIDTYDKYLWTFRSGGSDTALAAAIQRYFTERDGRPLVPGEEILDLIHFASKDNTPRCRLSSSHRRLLQCERASRVPTVLHHWHFLQGRELQEIELGFDRMPAREFYGIAAARLETAGFEVPQPRFAERKPRRDGRKR